MMIASAREEEEESIKIVKKKVKNACEFCQRSHITCDNERPCQRCIRRRIGHLCADKSPNHPVLSTNSSFNLISDDKTSIPFISNRDSKKLMSELPPTHIFGEPDDQPSQRMVNWKDNEIGYFSLIKFCQENFSLENQNRIAAAYGIIRPILRSTVKNLDVNSIQACEDFIDQSLFNFDTLASSIFTPFIVIRGTGEIMRVNNTFADIVKIPKNELEMSWRFHEIVAEESFVSFFEKIAPLYFHVASPPSAMISQCIFIPGGLSYHRKASNASSSSLDVVKYSMVHCSISISLKRDQCRLPSLLVITVIPS